MQIEFHVTPEHLAGRPNVRLDAILSAHSKLSRAFVQNLIARGHVLVNGAPARKSGQTVRLGDALRAEWEYAPTPAETQAIAGDLPIVWEDEHLIVINKPQGLVVHPAASYTGPTLVHHLLHYFQQKGLAPTERMGIVHRLDKGTSGLILVAKTQPMSDKLSALFKSRQIQKTYEDVVWGRMPARSGRFDQAIGRDRTNRLKISSRSSSARAAQTDWQTIASFSRFTHVRLHPRTGRTHHLRVHLSEGGNPILGDSLYGSGLTP